jgi:hypothetical protein
MECISEKVKCWDQHGKQPLPELRGKAKHLRLVCPEPIKFSRQRIQAESNKADDQNSGH